MSRKRKILYISSLIKTVNEQLARTDKVANIDFKIGICVTIENILIKEGLYDGFVFINNDDSEIGTIGYYSRIYF